MLGGKKKQAYTRMPLNDTPEARKYTEERLWEVRQSYPGIGEMESRVLEIISRLEGDNGLSNHRVHYLTAAIMNMLEEGS